MNYIVVPGQPKPNNETVSVNQGRVTSVEGYLKKAGLGVTSIGRVPSLHKDLML